MGCTSRIVYYIRLRKVACVGDGRHPQEGFLDGSLRQEKLRKKGENQMFYN